MELSGPGARPPPLLPLLLLLGTGLLPGEFRVLTGPAPFARVPRGPGPLPPDRRGPCPRSPAAGARNGAAGDAKGVLRHRE